VPTKRRPERAKARKRLLKVLDDHWLDADLVSAVAGDRKMSSSRRAKLARAKRSRKDAFYSDLLFALTHRYFPVEEAKRIWSDLVRHKDRLNEKLGRSVGIAVAAADFFHNIEPELDSSAMISGCDMTAVAEVALRDGLTRLYDHSTFRSKLEDEVARFRRYGTELSVVMLDIDNFKKINDTYGHGQGDAVLAELSEIISDEIRETDIAARYGGEEFAILLVQDGLDGAMSIAERIRSRVEREFAPKHRMTVSIGVASCPRDGRTAKTLVRKADRALYKAKRNGKNRVCRP
jgi:diguanylate cyclase (GGDEF)-like protein